MLALLRSGPDGSSLRRLTPQVVGYGAGEGGADDEHARHDGAGPGPALSLVQQPVARDCEDDAEELRGGAQDAGGRAFRRGVRQLRRELEAHRDVAGQREPAHTFITDRIGKRTV